MLPSALKPGLFSLTYQQKFEKIFGKRSQQSNMTAGKKSGVIYVCLCTYKPVYVVLCADREKPNIPWMKEDRQWVKWTLRLKVKRLYSCPSSVTV